MDVKNKNRIGYKKTKVGWIPENWEEIAFGLVFEFLKTYAFSRAQLTLEPRKSSGIYNIHYGDIHATYTGYVLDLEKERAVPLIKKSTETPSNLVLLREGDLIIADASEDYEGVGACIELRNIGNRKVTGGLHTFVARDKGDHFALGYRSLLLKHPLFERRMKQISTGVSVHGISKGNLSKEKISLPPLPEQEAIVGVLECWDKAIWNYEKRIEKKRNIKKGLMKRLLSGKQRLPGFSKEWKEVLLGDVFVKIIGGGTPSKKEVSYWKNGDIPWASIKDFTSSRLRDTLDHITDAGLKNSASNLIPANTLLLATRMAVGKCLLTEIDTSINQDIKALFLKENIVQIFIFYLFQSLESYFNRIGSGSTVKGISLQTLQNTHCRLPTFEEQQAIASVLSASDSEIEAMERKLALLKEQKKFLLNNLVTGTIRLPQFRGGITSNITDGDQK